MTTEPIIIASDTRAMFEASPPLSDREIVNRLRFYSGFNHAQIVAIYAHFKRELPNFMK